MNTKIQSNIGKPIGPMAAVKPFVQLMSKLLPRSAVLRPTTRFDPQTLSERQRADIGLSKEKIDRINAVSRPLIR